MANYSPHHSLLPQRRYLVSRFVLWTLLSVTFSSGRGSMAAAAASSATTTTTTTTSSRNTQYESVRALDQYGNAVQLQNARAAADQQGRLVIGVQRRDEFWILSAATQAAALSSPHQRPMPSLSKSGSASTSTSTSSGNGGGGMVHRLWSPPPAYHQEYSLLAREEDANNNERNEEKSRAAALGVSAIVCTGVQADALWLIRRLQGYQKNQWERFNTNDCNNNMLTVAADQMRLFWGRNAADMWQGSAAAAATAAPAGSNNQDNSEQWARPLGVRALLLQGSDWYLVEPSGSVVKCHRVCCMGPNSAVVQQKLIDELEAVDTATTTTTDSDINDEALQELIVRVLTSTLGSKPTEIFLEVVSGDGIERRSINP